MTTRLSVSVDPRLLDEAKALSGARSKREVIEQALRELIRQRKRQALVELSGSGLVEMDLSELQSWRESGARR